MKKILAITACVSLLTSGVAFATELPAAGGVTATDGLSLYGGIDAANAAGTSSTLIGKLSKGVKAGVRYDTETPGTGYAVNSKHDSGTTAFGTANDSTAIYKSEIGTTALTAPTAPGNAAFSTWTAMIILLI